MWPAWRADLWASLSLVVPPGYGTLQVIMLDTVTLLGELQPPATRTPASAAVTAAAVASSARVLPVNAAVVVAAVGEETDAEEALAAVTGAAGAPSTTADVLPAAVRPAAARMPAVAAVAPAAAPRGISPAAVMPATAAGTAVTPPRVTPVAPVVTPGAARRHLSDFNLPDEPPPESTVQWAWLEARAPLMPRHRACIDAHDAHACLCVCCVCAERAVDIHCRLAHRRRKRPAVERGRRRARAGAVGTPAAAHERSGARMDGGAC
jgi:hypothetical protein